LNLGDGEMVLRVVLAVVLGGAIGVEREIDAQAAGFRTHVVLCLGAALFGLISVHAFAVGLGFYWAAVAVTVTVATLLSLVVFRWLRRSIRVHLARWSELVSFRLSRGEEPAGLVSALRALPGVSVRSQHVESDDGSGPCAVVVGLKAEPRVNLDEMLATLAQRADADELLLEER
jgi:uncharacterized membrane protein YhiD involved in acid resistance